MMSLYLRSTLERTSIKIDLRLPMSAILAQSKLFVISVLFSAVVVYKKTKTRTRKESSAQHNDVEYKAKTKSVKIPHKYRTEGRPHRASPPKRATELTTGVGSEQVYEEPEPMYEPFGRK